jgi:hypothetical protein
MGAALVTVRPPASNTSSSSISPAARFAVPAGTTCARCMTSVRSACECPTRRLDCTRRPTSTWRSRWLVMDRSGESSRSVAGSSTVRSGTCSTATLTIRSTSRTATGLTRSPTSGRCRSGPAWDCVVCCEVLEHTASALVIIANAYRALLHDGVFIMTCAGERRAEHSAFDGGPLRPGEFYRNVSESQLDALVGGCRVRLVVDRCDRPGHPLRSGEMTPATK